MRTFTPIWSMITDSSLWDEPDFVVKVFMTMLAKKDSDHVYRGNAYMLGIQSRKPESEVLEALKILSSPDARRIEKQEFNGRRIKAVEDGWLILNGENYRAMMSDEMRKARLRRAQAAYRQRKKGTPLSGENAAVKADNNGDTETFDRLAAGEKGA